MKDNFCGTCGSKIIDGKCPKCDIKEEKKTVETNSEGVPFGWAVLGFFFPLIGFILFLCWIKNKKKSAKFAGLGALIGFILSIIVSSLVTFLFFRGVIIANGFNDKPYYPPVIDYDDDIDDDEDEKDSDDDNIVTIYLSDIDTSKSLSQYNFTSDALQVIETNKEYDVSNQGFKLLLKDGTLSLMDDVTGEVYDTVNNVTKAYYHTVDCSGWDSIVVYSGNDIYYVNPHNFSYLNVKFKKLTGKYDSIYTIRNITWTCGCSTITVGTSETAKGDTVLYDLNTETIFAKDTYNFYESNTKFIRSSRSFQFDSISGSAKLVIKSSVTDGVLGVINFIDTGYDLTNVSNPKLGKVTRVTVKDDVTTLYLEDGTTKVFEYSEIEY